MSGKDPALQGHCRAESSHALETKAFHDVLYHNRLQPELEQAGRVTLTAKGLS